MDKDTAAKFDEVFSAHKAKREELHKAREKKANVEKSFLETFNEFAAQQIKPILEDIRQYLAGQATTATVEITEEKRERDGKVITNSEISLTLKMGDPDRHYQAYQLPRFSIRADSFKQKAIFFESTMSPNRGGHSGGTGEYALELVTRQLIDQKVLAWLKAVFS
jgi:hypothetical protein